MARFTSKDVARVAGVAQSTVSYVLTGKRSISEETRRRVQDAIDQLTYQPNAGARALASQRTSVIGLMMPFGPGVDTAGQLPFIETIALLARAQDYDVLLVTTEEGAGGLHRLAGRSLCDAIIIMDVHEEDERVPLATSLPVPVLLIGVPADSAGLQCVDVSFEQAAELAVTEMATTKHDRIMLIGHPEDLHHRHLNFIPRFNNRVLEVARHLNLPCEYIASVENGRDAARKLVARILADHGDERLGLIIPNTQVVQPILHALTANNLVPGQDVSVIAHCTDEVAEETEPPVTNVSLEPREVSRRAIETVFHLLDNGRPKPDSPIDLVPSRLTRRDTIMPIPDVGSV